MKTVKVASEALDIDGEVYQNFSSVPGVRRAQKVALAEAIQMTEPFLMIQANKAEQRGEAGDWLLQAGAGDIYIVKNSVFRELYQLVY
jgi:hypothetical protein